MNLILIVLASVLAAARADCEACVDGWCYSRKTLLQGLHDAPAMDIDRNNSVLYVHFNPNIIAAYFLETAKIQLIETPDSAGIAVNQNTQVMFTAGARSWYTFQLGSNITQINTDPQFYKHAEVLAFDDNILLYTDPQFYKHAEVLAFDDNILLYTEKCCKGLSNFQYNAYFDYSQLYDLKITDFVRSRKNGLYVVANESVYRYNVKFTNKKYGLSVDKAGEIYFGDLEVNIIYKLNATNKQLDPFAVYKTGKVGKLVFDKNDDIIFYDSADATVNRWIPKHTTCTFEAPHTEFRVVEGNFDTSCNEIEPPNQE